MIVTVLQVGRGVRDVLHVGQRYGRGGICRGLGYVVVMVVVMMMHRETDDGIPVVVRAGQLQR